MEPDETEAAIDVEKWEWMRRAGPIVGILIVLPVGYFFFLPLLVFSFAKAGILKETLLVSDGFQTLFLPIRWLVENFEPYQSYIRVVNEWVDP